MIGWHPPLATTDASRLDPSGIFDDPPPNRRGEADRRHMDEVLADGFGNRESAHMVGRFETAFAEKFGARFAVSHNSGLIPPNVPAGCTHSYRCYTCAPDTGRPGVDWRALRKTFSNYA